MEQKVLGIVSPVPTGDWASNTVYQNLNIVRHNGASYIAKSSNTNIEPGVTVGWGSYWMLLNDDGEIGQPGPKGDTGEGVPSGGLTGSVLAKGSNNNYDSDWIPQNQLSVGSAEKDGQGNIISDTYITNQDAQETYETKSDSLQKFTSLQSQITQNTQTISRNSKRLDGLEQRINPSPFVTDNSVAYQKDVPSNAVGAVDIQVVGGMTYKDGDTLRSAPVTEVKSVGANLIPYPYVDTTKTVNGITFTDNGDGTITANGTATNTAFFILSNVLSLPSGNYYISDAAKNGSAYVQAGSGIHNTSINVNGAINGIELRVASGTTLNTVVFKPMLNKGSTALSYTPYVEHTLPIPTAVQALDGYGEGVNESVYNYIDWEKKQFVKRVGVVDLGALTWSSISSFFVTTTSLPNAKANNAKVFNMLCAIYNNKSYNELDVNTNGSIAIRESDASVWVRDSSYSDAASFKAAMAGVMLYYELAEPVVTDISNIITSDNLLSIQGNGTLTFENEYGYAVPSTVEYITAEATA